VEKESFFEPGMNETDSVINIDNTKTLHVKSDHMSIFTPNGSSLSLSPLNFNGRFPGGPKLADIRMSQFWNLLELRTMAVVSGDKWSYKTNKYPVKPSLPTNQLTAFYRPDAVRVAHVALVISVFHTR